MWTPGELCSKRHSGAEVVRGAIDRAALHQPNPVTRQPKLNPVESSLEGLGYSMQSYSVSVKRRPSIQRYLRQLAI